MPNAAFLAGFQSGEEAIDARRQRKQALEDEERKTRVTRLYSQGDALAKLIPSLSADKQTAAQQQLADIEQSIAAIYHPSKNPGALQRDFTWLSGLIHPGRKPASPLGSTGGSQYFTQTMEPGVKQAEAELGGGAFPDLPATTQRQVLSPPGSPYTAQPAATLPALKGLPTQPQKVAVGAPATQRTTFTPALQTMSPQQRRMVEQRQKAEEQARIDVAAAGEVNPFLHYRNTLIDAGFTPEQADKAMRVKAEIEAKPVDRRLNTFDEGFERYLTERGIDPADATAEDERDYRALIHPHPPSMYQSQRGTFAASLGKTPDQLSWADEQQFLTQRYGASQPYAQKRVALAEEHLRVDQANLDLRRAENNMKDFLSIQKQLSPMEKVATTSKRVDEYVNDPSGPGDIALVFSFIEAVKPSSGFRFTESERKWILGSRGVIDAAQARINQGFEGTVLSPDQRQHISAIIKSAAAQSDEQENRMLGAMGAINPTAAGAAGAATGTGTTPAPGSPQPNAGAPQQRDKNDKFLMNF